MRVFAAILAVLLMASSVRAQEPPGPIVVDLDDQGTIRVTCPGGVLSGAYDQEVYDGLCTAYTPTPEPTETPTETPTKTPLPTPTDTPLPTATATALPVPTAVPLTVSFNDMTALDRQLIGQYPSGLINWGTASTSKWWIGGPYGQFPTNAISFLNAQTTAASFTFVNPRILLGLTANNVAASGNTTLTISCTGNPNVVRTVAPAQVLQISTGWTVPCTTVSFTNSNGWNNDYDDLIVGSGPSATSTVSPASPTQGPTSTPVSTVAQGPCTGTVVGSGGQSTIAAGITATAANGTVCVKAGTYAEQVTLGKRLTLQAFGDGPVWIDGGCARNHGISINTTAASSSLIRGLGIRNTVDAGIKIDGAGIQGVSIDGNTIQNFDCQNAGPEYRAGIAVWYGGVGERITNNTISRRTAGSLAGGISDCIWFKSTNASPSGGGHYIAGNTLVGCWDGIGGETEGDSRGSFDRNTTIENNTITDCEDDGIQSDGGNLNNIIRNNMIKRCALGISNAPNLTGPVTIEGNTITEGRLGSYGNLACFKVGAAGSAVANYTNNRCVITAPVGVGWSQTNPGNNPIVARGNLINVTNYVLEFSSSLPSGTSFDQDCLYTSDPSRFVKWGGVLYGSIAAFRGLGQEANGTSSSSCGG